MTKDKTLTKKICPLESCRKEFIQKRKWQEFCCPAHQKEYWGLIRKDRRFLAHRVREHEKRIQELEKRIERSESRIKDLAD